MFDFVPAPDCSPKERYQQLFEAVEAITRDEPDAIANMANVASLLDLFIPDCNWTGFYRVLSEASEENEGKKAELVLGPFAGKPACIRIPLGQGVCGAAAESGATQLVEDVHAFPGHIACDAASRSELVVPIKRNGQVIAVIDLDSPTPTRFTQDDAQGLERLAELLSSRI